MREIIVDNFAGGGGASTGIELATGHSVDIAINHDPAAIAMHRVNHPETVHYCESVWDVDGKDYPKTAQVARCGNSVPPQFAEALVRANLPELCTGSGNLLTLEKYSEAVGQLELSM